MPSGWGKCWEEFKGWLKSFTPIELLLTLLEAILLVLLILFIVFLILHFLSCPAQLETVTTKSPKPPPPVPLDSLCSPHGPHLCPANLVTIDMNKSTSKTTRPTCTYTQVTTDGSVDKNVTKVTDPTTTLYNGTTVQADTGRFEDVQLQLTDGELAEDDEKRSVMALVKIKPSGLIFGCILTVVSERWTLTAASCLDSIEEVDSLDNFVIIDNYDEPNKGRSHTVADVRVHPLFEGRNKSYDLALLRTDDGLGKSPVRMPSLLDYFKLTAGEAVKILGFGPFRTIDTLNKRVHSAIVHVLPIKHCTPSESMARHLVPLSPVVHGRCGVGPVCGGVLYARGTPCNYCAGAPLLRARVLLGVMADHEQCGAACEPALYANIASCRDWIEQVLAN